MLFAKTESIRPLLESENGIHLSAYISNPGNMMGLRNLLRERIDVADEYLSPIMKGSEIKRFLYPITTLIEDEKRLKHFTGNLAIFRTPTSFRVLNLPVEVENSCIVADTFHVKPLLKWMQIDCDFLLLGIESETATLYQGNLFNFRPIDSVIFPRALGEHPAGNLSQYFSQTGLWLRTWIMSLTTAVKPRLYVAGNQGVTRALLQVLPYEDKAPIQVWPTFSAKKAQSICEEVRKHLRVETRKAYESSLVEFHYASDLNLAKGNIFSIARAAVEGKIRKLLISDGIKIFGKIDRKSGEIAIHRRDLDHVDDDILDDLAQLVLARGGEVIVASKHEIPKGRPILAITDDPSSPEISNTFVLDRAGEYYRERSAV